MQVQVDIEFAQLVRIIKALPPKQLDQLRAEIDCPGNAEKTQTDLEALLLSGPVATEQELEVIDDNRKAINKWRIK